MKFVAFASLSLFVFCNVIQAYEFECDPNRVEVFHPRVITELNLAFQNFIAASFVAGTSYARGQMLFRDVVTSVGTFFIRLYLVSGRGNGLSCGLNPDPNDREDGLNANMGFTTVLSNSIADMTTYCSTSVIAQQGAYLIGYYLEGYQGSILSNGYTNNLTSVSFGAPNITKLVPSRNTSIQGTDCLPFRSTMQSGYKGMPASFVPNGYVLTSPNGRYALQVMPDCYLGLFILRSHVRVWRSDNLNRDGKPCVLRLQEDGNLVLYDGNDPVWAIKKYCPECPLPSFASMQDDCNFVVYRSPQAPEVPYAAWASGTVNCGY